MKQQKRTSEVASEIARHFIQLFSTFFFERGGKQKLSGIKKARKLGVFRLFGGEGGIRTLAPVHPTYSLSRGAPSAKLGYFSRLHRIPLECWRRERDSNPRCLSASLVFKTSAINRSAISPIECPESIPNIRQRVNEESEIFRARGLGLHSPAFYQGSMASARMAWAMICAFFTNSSMTMYSSAMCAVAGVSGNSMPKATARPGSLRA